jgi:hypothetical protein
MWWPLGKGDRSLQKEYLTALTANGGKAPYSDAIVSGELPEGIDFLIR